MTWEARLAWLLRAWRLHRPDSPFQDPEVFARALAGHGCDASPEHVLAWESGVADPPYAAWIGYERVLGLRHCALDSCREYLRVFLPAGTVPRLTSSSSDSCVSRRRLLAGNTPPRMCDRMKSAARLSSKRFSVLRLGSLVIWSSSGGLPT